MNLTYQLNICVDDESILSYYIDHKSAYNGDAGIDIYISENIIIPPNARGFSIKTGIRAELIDIKNNTPVSYFIVPRSSICKTSLRPAISISVIDSGYRGNLNVIVDNMSNEQCFIKKGTRLFQIIGPTLGHIIVCIKSQLSEGVRGRKGLGSSGIAKL